MKNWKKTFAIIWTGQFLSILSSTIVNFAIILWMSVETRSPEILAWGTVAALLPQALLGPVSGVFIDRWDRKKVMMLADSFIALCTLILAILFWLDIAHIWHIYTLLALRSVGSSFHMPAMQASVPLIAPTEELSRIAGINQLINSFANIAGPALSVLLITWWDMEYVLMIDVAGAMFAVTSLLFVRIPNPPASSQPKHVLREMKEGGMVILNNKGLSWIFLFSILATFFIMPVSMLFPLMTLEHFNGTEFQMAVIEICWSVGALSGGAVMGVRIYHINKTGLVNFMYILVGLTFMLSGVLSPNGYIAFAILTAIGGVAGAIYNASFTAIVQTNVEPGALGRVFSLFFTTSLIPSMIGVIGVGLYAEHIGLTSSFIVSGVFLIIIGIIAFKFPSAMKIGQGR